MRNSGRRVRCPELGMLDVLHHYHLAPCGRRSARAVPFRYRHRANSLYVRGRQTRTRSRLQHAAGRIDKQYAAQ